MVRQEALKPQDVAVALRLAIGPDAAYAELGADLSMSPSTAHEAVERLQLAGLLRPESRQVNRHALLEFLEHGVKYAFPAQLERAMRGIPTAHSGPALAGELIADEAIVWPDPKGVGTVVGRAISALCLKPEELPRKCWPVYELLTLVDAIRVGRARERAKAMEKLRERLAAAAAANAAPAHAI